MNKTNETNEHEPKLLWESEAKNPNNNEPFLSVYQARDYYAFAQRAGTDSIAFILVDGATEKLGLIYESKPPMDKKFNKKSMMTTAFGGSLDMEGKDPLEVCRIEVLEEAGYDVGVSNITYVGKTLVSSQMNQMCECFIVDVTGLEAGKTEADLKNEDQMNKDPDEFIHNKVIWMGISELMNNNDWKSIFIFSKYYYKLQGMF